MKRVGGIGASLHELAQSLHWELTKIVASQPFSQFDITRIELEANLPSDHIAMVVTLGDKRKFMHPRFLTRQEIEAGMTYDNLIEKVKSTLDGKPWVPYPWSPLDKAGFFTLTELEQAQEMIEQCKS